MSRPWTGDDKPYRAIRAKVDAAAAHGASLKTLTQEYKAKADRNRRDPQAQFSRAYASHKAYLAHAVAFPTADALDALSMTGVENVYEYTRLRFMLIQESQPNTDHLYLKGLGMRLLQRSPYDEEVRNDLIAALSTGRQGLPDALGLAQEWIKQKPREPKAHSALAHVYEAMWGYSRGRDRQYADGAVAEYRQYLLLIPSNDPARQWTNYIIKTIQAQKPW